jgi:hypothetical protein
MLCVRCLAMGFHPLKARLAGQFIAVDLSGPRGPLHQGVTFPRRITEIDVWQSHRNQSGARINWMFSTDKARTKMARAYPYPSLKES